MARFDRSFVHGVFWKMLGLGAVVAMVTAWLLSGRFGYSLALGALVGATSLRVTAVAVEKMLRAALDEDGHSALWGAVVALKLLALLFVVFVALVVLDAHPVAFVIGFKMILPALAWQAIKNPGHLDDPVDDGDHTEST